MNHLSGNFLIYLTKDHTVILLSNRYT